jgi:hypothetical protein
MLGMRAPIIGALAILVLTGVTGCAQEVRNSGGVPVRIPAGPNPECINRKTDQIWLTLYRVIETKKNGFFTSENQAEIILQVQAQSKPQSGQPLSFPLSTRVNTRPYSEGQVSLPVEYTAINGLDLTQKDKSNNSIEYTNLSINTTLVNIRSRNGLGVALQALTDITGSNKLPIPDNPYSLAANYLLGFANRAVQADIDDKNSDDKYPTSSLTLNFSNGASCSGTGPSGAGFESTGTKAILMSEGERGDGYVPIDQVNNYCWTAELTPSFVLKAAKAIAGKPCGDPSYVATMYKQVTNNFIAYFLQKQLTAARHQQGISTLKRQMSDNLKLCSLLGMSDCPAAKGK